MAIGAITSVVNTDDRYRYNAKAASVPSTLEEMAATMAISSEFHAACCITASSASTTYQRSVNPVHSAFRRESLNEYATTSKSGA